jgi:hypothetical protein
MSDHNKSCDENQIIEYLQSHPDFFIRHIQLLETMQLPHNNRGDTVSFIERQVELLRNTNSKTETRLHHLTRVARSNEHLLERLQQLIIRLIDSDSMEQAMEYLENALREDFHADAVELIIFDREQGIDRSALKPILDHRKSICGTLSPSQRQILFGRQADEIASAVAIPLCEQNRNPCIGLIAVGSVDPHRYHPEMGTVFVNHLGAVINKIFISHMDKQS